MAALDLGRLHEMDIRIPARMVVLMDTIITIIHTVILTRTRTRTHTHTHTRTPIPTLET